MKTRYVFLISIAFLLCINSNYGQNITKNNFKNTIYFGYPATLLDPPDLGFYLGYNPHFALNKYFDMEFQLSYAYGDYKRENGWFVHDGGNINYGNLLCGIRLYLFNRGKKVNPYFNILGGVSYYVDKEMTYENRLRTTSAVTIGLSGGLYLQINNVFNIGIALETYPSMVFKAGFTF